SSPPRPLTRVTVSHASVASRPKRGECSLFKDVASRALRLSFIRSHALSKGRAREGASCWRSRRSSPSEPRSLRQAEQVAVRASETAVRGAQEQRRSARNGDRLGTEKVGCSCKRYGADTMARLP